jgi:hypothetical protein
MIEICRSFRWSARHAPLAVAVALAAAALAAPPAALGAKLFVASNGVDGPACGTEADPCRSIGWTIGLAAAGDQIVVGPGRYGDLDGDNVFEPAAGEEAGSPGAGCFCMIRIDKTITLTSSAGAAVTFLDGGNIAALNVLQIAADDVVVGKPRRGFTLTGAGFSGLEIVGGASRARVTANVAVANTNDGFYFVNGGDGHVFTGNWATSNGSSGFEFAGDDHTLAWNTATGNGAEGYRLAGSGTELKSDLAASNGTQGFEVFGPGHQLVGSSAIGNGGEGMLFLAGGIGGVLVSEGNVYANGLSGGGAANCGIANNSGIGVGAPEMFWGDAGGPGLDPADMTCGANPVAFAPFSGAPFKVKTKIKP